MSRHGPRNRSSSASIENETATKQSNNTNEEEEIHNPLLNYVNELTRSQSISGARDARLSNKSSFKQKAKKIQSAATLSKLFTEKGKIKSSSKWKSMLQ